MTEAPSPKLAEQVPGQEMPAGADVTAPLPDTATEGVRWVGTTFVNVALTVSSFPMLNAHAPEPLQAPLQPAKAKPLSAVAVSRTVLPTSNVAEQIPGQAMAAGVDVTRPEPDTSTERFTRCAGGMSVNAAPNVTSPAATKSQAPVPVQAPDQPEKRAPGSGAASV